MFTDVLDLRAFYASALGQAASRSVSMAIASVWPGGPSEDLLGLGYAVPYIERFAGEANHPIAFMPAAQGAVHWPSKGPNATALVDNADLPLSNASVDRLLMVHLLEHAENPYEALKEAWRILKPGGSLIAVVPNRTGVWARFDHTPFGTGRPFSRGQLSELLKDIQFTPSAWSDALHFPPTARMRIPRWYGRLENIGRRLWPAFAGVIVVVAVKRMYQGLPVAGRRSRQVFVPVLAPQGSNRAGPGLAEPLATGTDALLRFDLLRRFE